MVNYFVRRLLLALLTLLLITFFVYGLIRADARRSGADEARGGKSRSPASRSPKIEQMRDTFGLRQAMVHRILGTWLGNLAAAAIWATRSRGQLAFPK